MDPTVSPPFIPRPVLHVPAYPPSKAPTPVATRPPELAMTGLGPWILLGLVLLVVAGVSLLRLSARRPDPDVPKLWSYSCPYGGCSWWITVPDGEQMRGRVSLAEHCRRTHGRQISDQEIPEAQS